MHEESEKKDDRKRNSDKPEKCAFAETHESLLMNAVKSEDQRFQGPLVPAVTAVPSPPVSRPRKPLCSRVPAAIEQFVEEE
jgi:hypothetical protein